MKRRELLRLLGGASIFPLGALGSPLEFNAKSKGPVVLSTWHNQGQIANPIAWEILKNKGMAIDAVEAAARSMESDWENCCEQFDSYEELIEFMADTELRFPDTNRWSHIFKTDQNMLELYMNDVNKRYMEMFEEKMRDIYEKKALEAELEREREAQYLIRQEERERALFEELSKKYGHGQK
jgi:hypothetical protein